MPFFNQLFMKRKIIYLCVLLLIITPLLYAQHAIGSWQNYLSYHNVTRTEPAGNLIYAIGNGSLFCYDKEDTSVQCFWKGDLLSDTDISYIAYSKEYKTLIIIYSNSNIDLLVDNSTVYNLPDYMNKNMTQSKGVNHICFAKEYAYLSTPFGVITLNLKKREITNTYILNKSINACAVDDTQIYAASSEGLFTGLLTANLLDINNWNKVSDNVYIYLANYNGNVIGDVLFQGIFLIDKSDYSHSQLVPGYYSFMYMYGDKLIASNENSSTIFDKINDKADYHYNYLEHYLGVAHLSYENGIYWAAEQEKGLIGVKYNETDNTMETIISSIIPDSPKRNFPNYMKFEGEKLFITGGGTTEDSRTGTIMVLENNTWSCFEESGISEKTGVEYRNISSIVQDPTDERHHFASSFTEGLYEFYDKKFVNFYSYKDYMDGYYKSPLEIASSIIKPEYFKNFVRVNGLTYTDDNNLWMANCEVPHPIHVLKPNKEWISLSYPEVVDNTNFKYIIFDDRGWLWAVSTKITCGIFCLNINNTLEDISNHQHRFRTTFTNQDGNVLSYNTTCMAIDRNGAIWVGTDKGPIIFNNPNRFFEDDFYCTQIKVPRDDGTNLADYLLANEKINAITVDAGNRKWIGTEMNGVYLLSPDGLETIHHFTSENSPLLSNSIQSIIIHPRTGEVFIGTSKGLVSYQSDATEPEDNFAEDNVYVYPNPVKSDYTGVITVTGLMQDTDIKITNVSGKLIHAGTSVGGQFTWDGKNQQGKRVPSGVYFVLAANAEGKEGIATKILFIR